MDDGGYRQMLLRTGLSGDNDECRRVKRRKALREDLYYLASKLAILSDAVVYPCIIMQVELKRTALGWVTETRYNIGGTVGLWGLKACITESLNICMGTEVTNESVRGRLWVSSSASTDGYVSGWQWLSSGEEALGSRKEIMLSGRNFLRSGIHSGQ